MKSGMKLRVWKYELRRLLEEIESKKGSSVEVELDVFENKRAYLVEHGKVAVFKSDKEVK